MIDAVDLMISLLQIKGNSKVLMSLFRWGLWRRWSLCMFVQKFRGPICLLRLDGSLILRLSLLLLLFLTTFFSNRKYNTLVGQHFYFDHRCINKINSLSIILKDIGAWSFKNFIRTLSNYCQLRAYALFQ